MHDKYLDNVTENLKERFADADLLGHFAITFDPARLQKDGSVFLDDDQVASLQVFSYLW